MRVLKLITYNGESDLDSLFLLKIHRKLKESHQGEKLLQIHHLFWEVVHSVNHIINPVIISSWSKTEKMHVVISRIDI